MQAKTTKKRSNVGSSPSPSSNKNQNINNSPTMTVATSPSFQSLLLAGQQQSSTSSASRGNSNNNNGVTNNNSAGPKRDIACTPGTVREFFLMFFLGCSRKILGVKAEHKLAIYLLVVFLGSLFAELFTIPKDLLPQKLTRPLNTFITRFGYGWILVITTPLILITSRIVYPPHNNSNIVATCSNLTRLVVNSFCWFVTTNLFFWFYSSNGMCVVMSASNNTHAALKNFLFNECKRSGYQWSGTDISGHTFLLIFCNLILIEEARVMRLVDKVLQQQQPQNHHHHQHLPQQPNISTVSSSNNSPVNNISSNSNSSSSTVENLISALLLSKRDRLLLQILLCVAGATCVAYDYILFITVFYYHTILEKMLALVIASASWYLCYRVFYVKMAINPGHA